MNLIIDIGNTAVKLAVFKESKLLFSVRDTVVNLEKKIHEIFLEYPKIKNSIIASVGNLPPNIVNWLKDKVNIIILNNETKLPFKNQYKTPKTLGVDRIGLISAAVEKYPNKNVLIIDAGSCITYDFVTDKAEYLGGAISPGLRMRYKALNTFTAGLPLLETKIPQYFVGNSTESSMHSGVVCGILNEIDGFVKEYQNKYSDLTVILTGGDANFLSKQLKSSIFANSNFLLQGLNYILRFNLIE
ncbi:type III pantothenate kinase [Mangrovimonas spongiae]|uniref:Type III pantothenate kinase n=1 Tax=Mangrovimonas spongiae TaxID=2494697 RepID=A0A3R9MGZ4_9FLAO|nr:type III pantothenate kinase [Mangrovimonas spongiae]RSK41929.1 type III pantothenate kinase [Mangrovimonas spongiae]